MIYVLLNRTSFFSVTFALYLLIGTSFQCYPRTVSSTILYHNLEVLQYFYRNNPSLLGSLSLYAKNHSTIQQQKTVSYYINNSINGLSASAKSIFFISSTVTHFASVCSDNFKSPLISLHLYAYKVIEKSSYGAKS